MVEKRNTPGKRHVVSDEVIFFYSMAKAGNEYFFRRIEVWDEEQQKTFVFLTNHLQFGATTIAAIYKDLGKWNSFLAIKQNLKITTFLGTSANAVHTQIWTALIAMLVLRYLQLKSTFGGLCPIWPLYCGISCLCIETCSLGSMILSKRHRP